MSRLSIALALVAFLALPGAARAGEKYALVVGVDRYRETELSSLDFAAADAIRLGAALERLGFDVITMTPQADRVSLRPDGPRDILESLDRRLKFRDRNDTIVVALSGHGVQLVGDAATPEGTRETWFCPAKARLDDRGTLLPISEVIRRMGACPAARKLLLVDACRNDMTPPGAGKARDVIVEELDPAAPARRLIPDGMVALFSCSSQERSFERKELGHSLFSYHVIRYLEGAADDPARWYEGGEATLTDLVGYAQKRTARSAEDLAADQTPELVGRMTNWSFGRVGGDLASVDRKPAMDRPLPTVPPVTPVPKPARGRAPGEVVENSLGMKLVVIPAGQFEMGSNEFENEQPIHAVRITKPFLMGQTEVTQGQWERVMGTTPWRGKEYVKDGPTVAASYVSWDDAVEFCRKLTEIERQAGRLPGAGAYRLPTEAEWEYACRAGTKTKWSFGDDESRLGEFAWFRGNADIAGEEYAHEVGQKKPSPWGLHDMHGNVWEWCSDWYDEEYYKNSPAADPKRPDAGSSRLIRGGSWYDLSIFCRSATRVNEASAPSFFGFRVVCELE